jgi:hypothetical protein
LSEFQGLTAIVHCPDLAARIGADARQLASTAAEIENPQARNQLGDHERTPQALGYNSPEEFLVAAADLQVVVSAIECGG